MAHIDGSGPQAPHALRHICEVLEQFHVCQPAIIMLISKTGHQQGAVDVMHRADLWRRDVWRHLGTGRERVEAEAGLTDIEAWPKALLCRRGQAEALERTWMGLPLQVAPPLRAAA
jgi:hypothetical protein